ncbi:ABC transporter substrate-binding protein [bacterium RCC_150]
MRATAMLSVALAGVLALGACSSATPANQNGSSNSPSPKAVNEQARALLPADVTQRGTLRMTGDFQYRPFDYMEGNERRGFDFELGNMVAESLGLKPQWETTSSFGAIIPSIQNSRFDAALASINVTPARLQAISFVTYLRTHDVLVVAKGNPGHLDASDLCGAHLSVETGSSQVQLLAAYSDDCVQHGKKAITRDEYGTADAMYLSVQSGRSSGISVASPVAPLMVAQSKGALEEAGDVTVFDTGKLMRSANLGVAIAKGDGALGKAVAAAIKALQSDGSFDALLKKFNLTPDAKVPAEFVTN